MRLKRLEMWGTVKAFRISGNNLPPNQQLGLEDGNYLQVIDQVEDQRGGGAPGARVWPRDVRAEALLREHD